MNGHPEGTGTGDDRLARRREPDEVERRLLDAAFDLLLENGISGTTIAAVTRRAGVSNGTLFSYYPSKDALLVATTRDLGARMFHGGEAVVRALGPSPTVERSVDVMWRQLHSDVIRVAFELHAASRTNAHLRVAFAEFERDARAATLATLRRLYPEIADAEGLELYSLFVLVLMQGIAVHDNALGPQPPIENLRPLVARVLEFLRPEPPADISGNDRSVH